MFSNIVNRYADSPLSLSVSLSHLMTDPKSRKVIVVENPLLSTRVKEMIARVLFGNLQVWRLWLFDSFDWTDQLVSPPGAVIELRLLSSARTHRNRHCHGSRRRLRQS